MTVMINLKNFAVFKEMNYFLNWNQKFNTSFTFDFFCLYLAPYQNISHEIILFNHNPLYVWKFPTFDC